VRPSLIRRFPRLWCARSSGSMRAGRGPSIRQPRSRPVCRRPSQWLPSLAPAGTLRTERQQALSMVSLHTTERPRLLVNQHLRAPASTADLSLPGADSTRCQGGRARSTGGKGGCRSTRMALSSLVWRPVVAQRCDAVLTRRPALRTTRISASDDPNWPRAARRSIG
jgi:hypothetical protein